MAVICNGNDCDKKLNIIRLLIEKAQADPNLMDQNGHTALMMSAAEGCVNIIKYFLDQCKMTINLPLLIEYLTKDRRMGHCSANYLSINTINYLITEHGLTAKEHPDLTLKILITATQLSSKDVIKRLLEKDCGINIDTQDEKGWTALMYATEQNNTQMIEYLVKECRANVLLKNNKGLTALDIAQDKGTLTPAFDFLNI